jgi:peptide/nickel transport system substrate-binding protein
MSITNAGARIRRRVAEHNSTPARRSPGFRGGLPASAAAAAALLVALAGAGVGTASGVAGASPDAAKAATSGGVASYALATGEVFTWILPLENENAYEDWDSNIEGSMWLPLYFAGTGSKPGIDEKLSIADPPVYSDGDTTVTVTLKPTFAWSTGKKVTSADVKFYFELMEAGKKKLGNYLPGLLPDNVKSVTYPSSSSFVLHLNHAYNPTWFTGNQLTWIYPLPVQAWDRTCATCPAGSAAATPTGAKKVFTFLFTQSKHRGTYSSNPLWKTVDGPWVISSYDPVTHTAGFSANAQYTGPTKPHLAGYKVYSFTTGSAEVNALRSGTLTFGYLPASSLGQQSYFKSHGYAIKPWPVFYNEVVELGYTSKTWGPLVKQLYIRQALQHLITQKLYISRTMGGYGIPDYGPVADYPGSSYVSPGIRKDPDPYNPRAASKLLSEHGWASGPGGVDVCKRPGTGGSDCGAGIKKGEKLSFSFMYSTGTTAFFQEVSEFQTQAKNVGIGVTLNGQTETTMFSIGGVCPTTPPCKYGLLAYSGFMWDYGQYQLVPSGTDEWGKGNFWGGGYYTAKAQRLITAVETSGGLKSLYADEDYLSKNLASLWWPLQDYEVVVVKKNLSGWQRLSPYANYDPQTWYFTSSPG